MSDVINPVLQNTVRARPVRIDGHRRPPLRAFLAANWMYYLMLLPAAVLLVLFHFYPIWGVSMAFVDYSPYKGMDGSPFVGLDNFRRIFEMRDGARILRNTLVIAIGKILAGQFSAVAFALLLHQVVGERFKRVVQILTTLPHFMSWIVIGGILLNFMSSSGLLNRSLGLLGIGPVRFFGTPMIFPLTLISTETWKEFGFGSIIYLAALTAINPDLYEAAAVDGAGRWRSLLNITIPGILPTIVLMSCLNLGNILSAGFEQILILGNPIVYETGDIIDTFVYRQGVLSAQYSLATAVGLVRSIIGFGLILTSYWLADKFANYRIF